MMTCSVRNLRMKGPKRCFSLISTLLFHRGVYFEEPRRLTQQLRRHSQVQLGSRKTRVTEVRRKERETFLYVHPFAVPCDELVHGEGGSEIVNPRPMSVGIRPADTLLRANPV